MQHGFVRGVRLEREKVPDFGRYPFDIPAVRDLETLDLDPGVTFFFIGENGSGKSTLLEAIAIILGLNPEGGSQNFTLAERPSESELHRYLTPIRSHRRPRRRFFLRAESLFNVASEAERINAPGWPRLHERSHGEAFLWLLRDRFLPGGLYLLDEPEAALSPSVSSPCSPACTTWWRAARSSSSRPTPPSSWPTPAPASAGSTRRA
ncbi:MAG: hypothetical protein SangKO_044340 [Sandaracinaceae bacterium]